MKYLFLLFVVGCSSPDAPQSPHEVHCPAGQTRVLEIDGGAHCIIAGDDWVNIDPETCHPVACQAWEDFALYGGGGERALDCAARCEARCSGATAFEAEVKAEMTAKGMADCVY
jgi:hypothetical protein